MDDKRDRLFLEKQESFMNLKEKEEEIEKILSKSTLSEDDRNRIKNLEGEEIRLSDIYHQKDEAWWNYYKQNYS